MQDRDSFDREGTKLVVEIGEIHGKLRGFIKKHVLLNYYREWLV